MCKGAALGHARSARSVLSQCLQSCLLGSFVLRERTPLAKWTVLTRIPAVAKSDVEYQFVIDMLAEGLKPEHQGAVQLQWKVAPMELGKESIVDAAQMLVFKFHLLSDLRSKFRLPTQEPRRPCCQCSLPVARPFVRCPVCLFLASV